MTAPNVYLQVSPFAIDEGELIGKIPSDVPKPDLRALGHPTSATKAIRAKCRDCVHSDVEIRKCVQFTCPLWPMRMGRNPLHGSAGD